MDYLSVPDSKLKLTDGNIVMLERFPGMKWILHNGWYNYNGRQYMGWYFTSIPSQTILPVNNQDLRMITVVSGKSNDAYPEYPMPPAPHHHCPWPDPHHHHHGPWPDPHYHHDGPLYPPVAPDPEPDKPAFFSNTYKRQLESAFISVPTLKKRDELDTTKLPDGKIVRVNSVNGEPRYYAWSAFNDHWEELNFVLQEDVDSQLEAYYTSTKINEHLEGINQRIDKAGEDLTATEEKLQQNIDNVDDKVDQLAESAASRIQAVKDEIASIQEDLKDIHEEIGDYDEESEDIVATFDNRVKALEAAVFDIKKLTELLDSNTVLVSKDGGIIDSGVNIGDGAIDEPSEYASQTTLATEKAVAKRVEDASLKWSSF